MPLHRPDPVLRHRAIEVDRHTPVGRAVRGLLDGDVQVVTDHYSTGAEILAQLAKRLPHPGGDASFQARSNYERRIRRYGRQVLVPIEGHRVALAGARPIGFLADLYGELDRFWLPLPDVQELHSAWGRYERGVRLTVLGHAVHPFFGTYAPTRTEHLELFAQWLHSYDGPRDQAIDVGTGCGVLAYLLAKAGFDVIAADVSANAVESVRRELERTPAAIRTWETDLLDDLPGADLVVFNPPWIPGEVHDHLDAALNFEPGLFERFFDQAAARRDRVVLVFSTAGTLLRPDVPLPIESELERGRFELKQKLQRRVKARRTRERVEIWDLVPLP